MYYGWKHIGAIPKRPQDVDMEKAMFAYYVAKFVTGSLSIVAIVAMMIGALTEPPQPAFFSAATAASIPSANALPAVDDDGNPMPAVTTPAR